MTQYIALVTDLTGRYAHVSLQATNWDNAIDQLEDAGCEVIEDQSIDWDGCTRDEIKEDCMSVHQLLTHSDFVPHL